LITKRSTLEFTAACIVGLLPISSVFAHHAANTYFDVTTVIEVRGVITDVKWQNPHIGFTLSGGTVDGEELVWSVESNSVSTLRQLGVTRDQLKVGDVVTVAGWPPRQDGNRIAGNHLLLPDGQELVLRGSGEKYFSEGTDDRSTVVEIDARESADAATLGLFRVWSTIAGDPDQDRFWEQSYPLTEAAIAGQAVWDPVADNPAIRCEPKGMPSIMDPPYPMELTEQGDVIIIRQEEFDTVRTVHMNSEAAQSDPEPSLLGYSMGRWEGDTLVVSTSHISWPVFDIRGIPQSLQARYEERFTVSANGKRLNYTIDITDPVNFTEPVRLDRFWLWMEESQVEPYNCTPL
jgi:hypothetical protein